MPPRHKGAPRQSGFLERTHFESAEKGRAASAWTKLGEARIERDDFAPSNDDKSDRSAAFQESGTNRGLTVLGSPFSRALFGQLGQE
jgi:hypothetical protein